MPLVVEKLLFDVVLPALAALAAVCALGLLRRGGRAGGPWAASAAGAAALALGYAAAHLGLEGWPGVPDRALEWVLVLVLASALLPGLERAPLRARAALRWAARGALILGALLLMFRPMIEHETWSAGEAVAWLGGLTVGALVLLAQADLLTRGAGDPAAPAQESVPPWPPAPVGLAAWLAVAGGAAGVMAISGSAKLGELSGGLGAAIGGLLIGSAWVRDRALLAGAGPVAALGLAALLADGLIYAEASAVSVLPLVVIPALVWASDRLPKGPLRARPQAARVALAALLAATCAGGAVGIAALTVEDDPYEDYY